MKDLATDDDTVIDRLSAALDADILPEAAKEHARHLIGRLSSPVRVSVMGGPGVGKSELINMFVGRRLIPKDAVIPTTELVFSEQEEMIVTAADGSKTVVKGIDIAALSGAKAAFLRLKVNASILRRVTLLEIVTDGTVQELEAAIDWAVRRTEIALWCSQGFTTPERALWARVPEHVKDHGFLVLTKADVLSAEKLLSKRVAALETVVAEEFHSLFAVATLQAIKAHGRDGVVDEAMFHASGGGALSSELLRHAERGRRADFDSAHLFLARHHIPDDIILEDDDYDPEFDAPEPQPEPADAPVATPATSAGDLDDTDAPEWDFDDVNDDAAESDAQTMAKPEGEEARSKVQNITLFAEAIGFLSRKGDGLTDTAEKLGEGNAKPLVENCVDAVEHLMDLFSQDESGCAAADAFIDELSEASDMMVLMQVESGDTPAADAVTLLLQLKRDMEMQLAA